MLFSFAKLRDVRLKLAKSEKNRIANKIIISPEETAFTMSMTGRVRESFSQHWHAQAPIAIPKVASPNTSPMAATAKEVL